MAVIATTLALAVALSARRPVLGGAIIVVAAGWAQLVVLRPRLARRTVTFVLSAPRAVALAAARVALTMVFVVLVVPGWILGLLFRSPPLGTTRRQRDSRWRTRAPNDPRAARRAHTARATGDPPPATRARPTSPGRRRQARRRSLPRPRPALVASFVLGLLAVDVLAGALLSGTGLLPPADRGDLVTQKREAAAETMAMPNVVDEPWAASFGESLADFQLETPTYVPFIVAAPHPFRSPHLNVEDGARRSYQPSPSPGATPLRVAFFGGSTTFGIGQRDEHTVPSEVARLAEEDGVTLEVHNYGFPAWVSWQEQAYFERLLAAGREFDLAVFYDGYNEFLAQRTEYSTDPTHFGASSLQSLATRFHEEHETAPGFLGGPRELLDAYRRSSGLWRTADHLFGTAPAPSWQAHLSDESEEEHRAAALSVYRRSLDLIRPLARTHRVPVRFFWQPTSTGWSPEVLTGLPNDVVDISDALDGRQDEVYISDVHTNEIGARMVAEAMWAELAPMLTEMADVAPPR